MIRLFTTNNAPSLLGSSNTASSRFSFVSRVDIGLHYQVIRLCSTIVKPDACRFDYTLGKEALVVFEGLCLTL